MYAIIIILAILGIAVIFAGLYILNVPKDDGIFDLDAYRRGEGK